MLSLAYIGLDQVGPGKLDHKGKASNMFTGLANQSDFAHRQRRGIVSDLRARRQEAEKGAKDRAETDKITS